MDILLAQLPSVPFATLRPFPNTSGVYLALTADDVVLYIGSSVNIKHRWYSHKAHKTLLGPLEALQCERIAWIACPCEELLPLETRLMARWSPRINILPRPRGHYRRNAIQRRRKCAREGCSHIFIPYLSNMQKGGGKYCSKACYYVSVPSRPLAQVIEEFWARVGRCPHAPSCLFCCWLWQGNGQEHYGRIHVQGHPVYVHRFSWALHNYPERIPHDFGPVIRHICHQQQCVNPAHLVSGNQSLNAYDTYAAGRHSNAKLTIKDVQEIRRLRLGGMPYKSIAALYPVGWSSIKNICYRRTWKHVP